MNKLVSFSIAVLLCAGLATIAAEHSTGCKKDKVVAQFGIITDIHHTNKTDIASRKYSAALPKTRHFVKTMNRLRADFIVELGDMLDMLTDNKNPVQNLMEVESIIQSFNGPKYHVLGNHEFDNVSRADLLSYLENTSVPQGKTYYSFNRNGIHCVVLDADYTNKEPHYPFDLQDAQNPFWNWKDAWIPQEQLDWLKADLEHADLPSVVFTHQLLHRDITEDHTIKNADAVCKILEDDGQVIAVFSGHDHRGEIAFRNGIHYLVLEGNVGMSLDWPMVSATEGLDPVKDSPFSHVVITEHAGRSFDSLKTYTVAVTGNAQQYSFTDQVIIKTVK